MFPQCFGEVKGARETFSTWEMLTAVSYHQLSAGRGAVRFKRRRSSWEGCHEGLNFTSSLEKFRGREGGQAQGALEQASQLIAPVIYVEQWGAAGQLPVAVNWLYWARSDR